MQSLQHRTWILPEDLVSSDVDMLLFDIFTLQSDCVKKSSRIWHDTFDWRLFRKKQRLISEGSNWILEDFQGRQLAALKNQRESFRFTWQLPDSPLRQILEKSMDVRGLHQIGVEDLEARSLRLCNTDKKTVSFLNIQQSTNRQNGNQRTIVRIKEVRGYRQVV